MEKQIEGKIDISIRAMEVTDLPIVLDIEERTFASPWTRQMFYREVALPISYFYVAVIKGVSPVPIIAGYGGFWVVSDEAHVVNFAVDERWRRKGIGTKMLEFLTEEAKKLGLTELSLDVRVSNEAAYMLYSKHGFSKVAVRKKYYENNNEDAFIMVRRI